MLFFTSGDEYKYDFTAPVFKTAFQFLKRSDLAFLPEGWIELENGVRASVQHYTTADETTLDFETHKNFFDIQYLIEGEEYIGACTCNGLQVKTPYSIENDVTFYHDPAAYGKVLLHAGDLTVLSPEDAHKPRCSVHAPMAVKKIVLKVPVDGALQN